MLFKKYRQALTLCQIKQATDLQLQEMMRAIETRYAQIHPDWEVIYMAVRKDPSLRETDIQNILKMLEIEKMDSLL